MNYPYYVDIDNNDIYFFKNYDIKIIERNLIYPFTYNIIKDDIVKDDIVKDDIVKDDNDFIKLPEISNLIFGNDGLPYIPV